MPSSDLTLERNLSWQLGLALVGVVAFCLYSRSWKDLPHLVYDVPASLAVFAFVAQLVLEARSPGHWFWMGRAGLLVAMTVVTVGREFRSWPISGHLSCVLAVAIVQLADPRLHPGERLLYWIPLPVVLGIRWWLFDRGAHGQTYNAMLFAVAGAVPVVLIARLLVAR